MKDPTSSTQGRGERAHDFALLDLLRWVSACAVAVGHVRDLLFLDYAAVDHSNPLITLFYALTGLGREAVIVFFVLSGYLVGGSLVRDGLGCASLVNYFVHRFSRIYIVLIPALIVTLLLDVSGTIVLNNSTLYDQADWASSLNFVAADRDTVGILACNVANLQGAYCPSFGSNGPLWSLAYEWFYYLTFPIILAVFQGLQTRRSDLILRVPLIVSLALLAYLFPDYTSYYPIWLMGVVARVAGTRREISSLWPRIALVALAVLLVVARARVVPGVSTDFLVGIALAVLILVPRFVASVRILPDLSHRLAGYSYSLYLVHFPLMVFLDTALLHTGIIAGRLAPNEKAFGLFAACLAIAYAAAWIFSLVTERQTGKLRHLISRQLTRWEGLGTAPDTRLNAGPLGHRGPHEPPPDPDGREA